MEHIKMAYVQSLQLALIAGLLILSPGVSSSNWGKDQVGKLLGLHAHDPARDGNHVCFQRAEFENMFSAKTSKPDGQLLTFLAAHPDTQHYPVFDEVHQRLFHTNTSIYADFKPLPIPDYGTGVKKETIAWLTAKLGGKPPRFMVEVGSFIGGSAAMWGKHLLQPNDGLLLCIDTWDGDINMWLLDDFVEKMARQHGSPTLYNFFLSRMIEEGLNDTVIPLRTSSTVGARMLANLQYHIDVVYLDSAHEIGETYFELNLYWNLLPAGGVLLGDDYFGFPAVKHDVDLFMRHKHLDPARLDHAADRSTWAIIKE